MEQQALSPNELRLIIAIAGAVILGLIYFLGAPARPTQGRRTSVRSSAGERVEPTLGQAPDPEDDGLPSMRAIDPDEEEPAPHAFDRDSVDGLDEATPARPAPPLTAPPRSQVGSRPDQPVERIVTLFVAARAGHSIHGSDLVVAAEKCGLEFGDMGIFHRLVDGKPEAGPIFSAANMIKPGHFDMSRIDQLVTPGLSFFMALPGPLPALDAWDTMLPTTQRLAELLDAVVLDEERNALGRQRIAHIRDELRAWDRRHEGNKIRPDW
ncbi:cell division protein ZipA [Tahibacter amnicola]|uniref:Cell division protein ZipA n=1 Tax=Tahibacter amnicola TaxID=2976241 RepID=A0ABY6B951_9GAMM|nr:cell division protein ZipA [Tahibacter amnicola]UXI66405.1 cell division protein ZipA [Tahibacter amnicola]